MSADGRKATVIQKSRLSPALLLVAHSEQQLQRELDLPRGRCGVCDDPARGAVVGALENNLIRVREIGVIQNIEYLRTELQIQAFAHSDLFNSEESTMNRPGPRNGP